MGKDKSLHNTLKGFNTLALVVTAKTGNQRSFKRSSDTLHIFKYLSSPEPSGSQGQLIVYQCMLRRPLLSLPSLLFQTSSPLKLLGQSKLNLCGAALGSFY